jgi:hypothetical protein
MDNSIILIKKQNHNFIIKISKHLKNLISLINLLSFYTFS